MDDQRNHDGRDDGDDEHDGADFDQERNDRALAFLAANGDEPLTPPLIVAGLLALAWWALLGWQAMSWWPRTEPALAVAVGVASVQRDRDGDVAALLVGDGAQAHRFECGRPGRWHWRVLHVPLVECRDAAVLAAASGRQVHVRFDRPVAGGNDFPRLLALTADGRPLWTLDDSLEAFQWLLWRGAFFAALFLLPGWWLHRRWRRRPA